MRSTGKNNKEENSTVIGLVQLTVLREVANLVIYITFRLMTSLFYNYFTILQLLAAQRITYVVEGKS